MAIVYDPREEFFIELELRFRKAFGREMTEEERRYFTLAEQATKREEQRLLDRRLNPSPEGSA